ncbi:MAG TPA: extracellular solute-binding protein [Candidatus Binatia bacterium]|nr:extracellular solute-binding protein [Candidatus Binatia bacterium]
MKPRELIGHLAILLVLAGSERGLGADAVSGSEQEWERTVKAAEQEGQVVVYKIATDAEWHAFQKRYPKIKVVLIQGKAAQIQQRLLAERRAGKFLADVVRLGGGTSTSFYKAKALDPIGPALTLAEVKDVSKWLDGKHHYNDIDNQYVFVYAAFPLHLLGYNQKLVDPKTLTSYWDLLDPKWKGKITIKDPKEPGGQSPLLYLYHNPQLGPDYLKKLFGVAGLTLVRDDRQQTDWLAAGKFPITLTSKATEVEEAKSQGLPVDVLDAHAFKKEGVGLEAGGTMLALVNKAPHPNAAKVLINWFLSREGQMAIQKTGVNEPGQNSLREDIPKEHLPTSLQRQKGVKYIRLWGAEVWDRESVAKFVNELVK